MQRRSGLPSEGIVLLCVVVLGWGSSWAVIKYALTALPPLSYRGLTSLLGGLLTLALMRARGHSLGVPREDRARLAWLAFFNVLAWNVLSSYATLNLPSGRAALLAYTMPLWCVPLSAWLLGSVVDARRVLALALGCAGVLVLLGRTALDLAHAPVGVLLMLSAALSWATGVVLMKRWSLRLDAAVFTGWVLVLGGLPQVLAALVVDGVPARLPDGGAIAAIAFSVLITVMLCNWAWNRLVLLVPVEVSSLSSLLTPLVGVASGALFLGEQPGWREAAAAALIVSAVAVINLRPKARA
ncbi:MAG: EamA family transporter [Candidatus Dactylopiibacterium sp.]|nr:EamA family transporter [Candidatus Dactylopiibacterium sp.]